MRVPAWRAVERELDATPPESPEAEQLQAEAAQLRDEYQGLVAQANLADPVPVSTDLVVLD